MLNTPVDRIRCSLVAELRVPARGSSLSVLPSPLPRRVGVHITTFEACSSFTRVTACRVAHPPYVGFIARLRPGRFPGSDARKLPSSTNNLLEWVLPPLVICAVEAHPVTPFFSRYRKRRNLGIPRQSNSESSEPHPRTGRYTTRWLASPLQAPSCLGVGDNARKYRRCSAPMICCDSTYGRNGASTVSLSRETTARPLR